MKKEVGSCIGQLQEIIEDYNNVVTDEAEKLIENLIVEKAAELAELATRPQKSETTCNYLPDENEPKNSEMSCDSEEDDFEGEDDGIAYASIRTAQIKNIDFSVDGVTTINMRHGEPIIFRDISEVMFIS